MQTATEWLWEQIDGILPYQDINTSQLFIGLLEQAKEMEKKQIIDALKEGTKVVEFDHIKKEIMTLQEAIRILKIHQSWRLGDDEVHMQKPSKITKALDTLLNYHIVDTNNKV